MKAARRWLLASPAKVPHYADGAPRSGTLDSPDDTARLVGYEEAQAALALHPGWLLGFALGPDGTGYHWQGIDLDKIVANGLTDIANLWTREGCAGLGYVEMSPSGAGLHIIGYGRAFQTLGSNASGIEAYAGGRYFTVTEAAIVADSPCHLYDLADYVEQALAPRHGAARPVATDAVEAIQLEPKTIAELRSALLAIRADEYALWIRLGLALRCLGDVGRALWLEWSATSEKFDPKEAARKWDGFRPSDTGYKAVFAEAQLHGWLNPASNAAQLPAPPPLPDETPLEMLDRLSIDWDDDSDVEVNDVVAGLVADEDVTLLGGHGGVGKGFLALQIACAVAAGEQVLFRSTRECRVLYYSAEDGRKRLTRRLRNLMDLFAHDPEKVKANLRVVDASELEPLYGQTLEPTPDGKRFFQILGPRADFANLSRMVEAYDPQLVVIDGASDTFDGNEIHRREVRAFIKMLRRVHPQRPIAVLVLVHIDRNSARGNVSNDDGYAGNAAWHNSCRRRMYLQVKVEKDDEGEPVSEAFVLRIMKNQDGVPDPDMELMRGQYGLWQIATSFTGELAREGEADHRETVLRLIEDYSARGKSISTSLAPQATTGVYATLSGDPAWPRSLTRKRTAVLVRELERAGDLSAQTYQRGNRGHGERWAVVRSLDPSNYDPAHSAQSGTE
jgi:RecA-family ATPase